jgi:hypothetical protein
MAEREQLAIDADLAVVAMERPSRDAREIGASQRFSNAGN